MRTDQQHSSASHAARFQKGKYGPVSQQVRDQSLRKFRQFAKKHPEQLREDGEFLLDLAGRIDITKPGLLYEALNSEENLERISQIIDHTGLRRTVKKRFDEIGLEPPDLVRCDISKEGENRKEERRRAGLTLVELMVVVTIIGILTAIIIPMASSVIQSSRITKAKSNMRQVGIAMQQYMDRAGGYFPLDSETMIDPKGGANPHGIAEKLIGDLDRRDVQDRLRENYVKGDLSHHSAKNRALEASAGMAAMFQLPGMGYETGDPDYDSRRRDISFNGGNVELHSKLWNVPVVPGNSAYKQFVDDNNLYRPDKWSLSVLANDRDKRDQTTVFYRDSGYGTKGGGKQRSNVGRGQASLNESGNTIIAASHAGHPRERNNALRRSVFAPGQRFGAGYLTPEEAAMSPPELKEHRHGFVQVSNDRSISDPDSWGIGHNGREFIVLMGDWSVRAGNAQISPDVVRRLVKAVKEPRRENLAGAHELQP